MQEEVWILLDDKEYDTVWNKVYSYLKFAPSVNPNNPFVIPVNYEVFNICELSHWNKCADNLIKSIFARCMCDDDFMYALDWQHSGFKYNPKLKKPLEKCKFIPDQRYDGGGYNAYFPDYYPDGDYYFFLAQDFTWGYLTHPWQRKLWIFGDCLINEIEQHASEINLVKCS